MVLVAVAIPAVVIGLVALVILSLPLPLSIGLSGALLIGIAAGLERREPTSNGAALRREQAPDLFAAVERICLIADLPRPDVVVHHDREPNSWIVAPPGRAPRLNVTQALLDLLDEHELEAVLAHELFHVVNRDAFVMSVFAAPRIVLKREADDAPGPWSLIFTMLIAPGLALLSLAGTNALSRYRELAADAGAAVITGRPSALASALLKVSDAVERIPPFDLRCAAAGNSFNLVEVDPVRSTSPVVTRLSATHPRLSDRLHALEALEVDLHR
jgi:heat shock protein HtpX